MTREEMALIIDLHIDGERQGPGSNTDTIRALDCCDLGDRTGLTVADMGCGTGASTRVLAKKLDAQIIAIDFARPFLLKLQSRVREQALQDRVFPVCANMAKPSLPLQSLDLIWAEGAIYNIGFSAGIRAWKPLLKPRGLIAISEIGWLTNNPPQSLRKYWEDAYPEITTVSGSLEKLKAAGYRVLEHFTLSSAAWLDHYYQPMMARSEQYLGRHAASPTAQAIMAQERKEMALYEKYHDHFSYQFYVAESTHPTR